MSKITDIVRAWTLGGGQSENERLLSLEGGDAWTGSASGRVLTSGNPPTWEESSGGGGVSGIVDDSVNQGPGALGMFSGEQSFVNFALYSPNLDASGVQTGPNAAFAYSSASAGSAQQAASAWSSQAIANLRCESDTGDDSGAFLGSLVLRKDTAAAQTRPAVQVYTNLSEAEALQTLRVYYNGRVEWAFVGGGIVAVMATPAAPDNADGDDGDWAFGGDGHLYFKAAGAWVEKV